jgi:hypothetical protein
MGPVAVFDVDGKFLRMAAVGGPLAAPWGVTLAPASFGPASGDLLVGNFSFLHSEINVFDASGNFLFTIPIDVGATAGGLWFLGFGTGGITGSPTLSFSPMVSTARPTGCLVPYQVLVFPAPSLMPDCQAWWPAAIALARRRRKFVVA